jgi:plastocyanin
MGGGSMRAGLIAAAVGAWMAVPLAGSASAGGGCHAGLTQGSGDHVEMVDACFTPSILEVDPGTEVTFTNEDPIVHNVSAYEWGQLEDMMQGDSFTATFTEEGIYPFACSYHPAMTGAVVVGDGDGPGSGATVTTGSADGQGPVAGAKIVKASTPVAAWATGGLVGLLVGSSLALIIRRRRTV